MLNTHTTNTNDNLARLLATENLRIVYDSKADTACFDTQSRILTMPVLKQTQASDNLANEMLLAHEVGHALFTPAGEEVAKQACYRIDPKNMERAKLFLNIVEDARIEREMQAKFPGLRRTFIGGYNGLLKNTNLFDSLLGKDVSKMPLIDRINLHFKLGVNAGTEVPFTPEEQVFVDRVAATQSFDDVVDVCEDIYTHMATTNIDYRQKMKSKVAFDANGDPIDGEYDDEDGDPMDQAGQSQRDIDDARKNQQIRFKGSSGMAEIPTFDMEQGIYKTADLIKAFKESTKWGVTETIDAVQRYNKAAVSRMVADFERKKSASEFQRATISRSGILDMTRIHQFQHEDDLFLSSIDIRKGKSHGIVLVLDWSSSMSGRMFPCLSQLSCLISFCRAVKIPYEVYCFHGGNARTFDIDYDNQNALLASCCWKGAKHSVNDGIYVPNTICVDNHFTMMRLTGSEVSLKDENAILNMVMSYHYNDSVGQAMGIKYPTLLEDRWSPNGYTEYGKVYTQKMQNLLGLCGTPLDEGILACMEIVPAFKAKHNLDLANCIFLTDGESTSHVHYHYNANGIQQNPANTMTYIYRGKSYLLQANARFEVGRMLRDIFRKTTGCNLINFFMRDSSNFTRFKTRTKDGFVYDPSSALTTTVEDDFVEQRNTNGWDSQFHVSFDKKADGDEDVVSALAEATTVVKIKNAFIRGMGKINTSRVLLNRVTDYITKQAGLLSAVRKQRPLDA